MSKLPAISGDDVVKALLKSGFEVHHRKGSHVTLKHQTDPARRVVIPVHKGKDLGRGLLMAIIKDAGMTAEELINIL